MKIAIFSDVHGNRFALEAVLKDIETCGVDEWANLGDQLFGGADPAGAWALQQQARDKYEVKEIRGNTDERLGEAVKHDTEKREMLKWLHSVLPGGAGEYVAGLPTSATLGSGAVLVGHGTPSSAWDYLLWDKKAARWKTDAEVLEELGDVGAARVVVVGHSHHEHLRQIGGLTVINCGAVSRQKDGCPHARWLLLQGEGDVWHATFRRVPYDVEAAAAWAEAHAHAGQKEAKQLRTGREE